MYVTRVALLQARAARTYALDLEFVKCHNKTYARSVVFVPFRRASPQNTNGQDADTHAANRGGASTCSASPPRLTELLEPAVVLELAPEVTLGLAEPLPCGHLLREMIDKRFALTPALTGVLREFQAEAEDALHAYQTLRKKLRNQRKAERQRQKKRSGFAAAGPIDVSTREFGEESDEIRDEGDAAAAAYADHDAVVDGDAVAVPLPLSSASSPLPSQTEAPITASAEAMVQRSLQMRVGLIRNFCGIDPYGVPNVRTFNKEALELLHAAPVDSRMFREASQHLRGLRGFGRGKNGYKCLAACTRDHPAFLQKVLRTVFETPSAWHAWLTECCTRVEADLRSVCDAHRTGAFAREACSSSASCAQHGALADACATSGRALVDFQECASLEELATRMNMTWAKLLRQDTVRVTGQREGPPPPPLKVFVYGNMDSSVIRTTLTLSSAFQMPSLNLPQRPSGLRRFISRQHTNSTVEARASVVADGDSQKPPSALQLNSPFEAQTIDLTRHPLFVASGFSPSLKKTLSLSAALEKAAGRDSTAAAVHALQRQHDPLWDAQALACLCTTAGVVR